MGSHEDKNARNSSHAFQNSFRSHLGFMEDLIDASTSSVESYWVIASWIPSPGQK